ncbi:asparaginase [Thioclava sp. F36-6]|uniref:asparaginase n=1 Tax=Thioclava sp. F36-6 TaxID=1915316 RepID=UPI00099772EC|nr:asparaginase [Thioclava sp. F36-6]OOY32122.1 L-asparaginase [Thioclava sp. F36-6]
MTAPEAMIELWRGGMCESVHHGHAVIFGPEGIEASWGDPEAVIFPRSSVKMIQALPLLESGAAEATGLTTRQLALSCASHSGAQMHRAAVEDWLATLGLGDDDLRCGAHLPRDKAEKKQLICSDHAPCQAHNNCSGKHAGFLTLNRHLGGGPDYVEIDHPVQRAVKSAFEEVTEETSLRYGIDGCSAPNFATSLAGLGRAMQFFAAATSDGDLRARAATRLVDAMMEHPELVAGEGRACTEIMREANGRVAVKTGAEGVYVAMLPDQKRGVALKITDGATRASEAAMIALLIRLGALDANAPVVHRRLTGPITNWRGLKTGELHRAAQFP